MKKILIIGAGSYIGTSFEQWVKSRYADYAVETLDVRDDLWREKSFRGYDAALHVAGIAHIRETAKNAPLYFSVNRDLAYEAAKKAKADGVRHFVFLSTMNVYGILEGVISRDTGEHPVHSYGKSKLEAEGLIRSIAGEGFKVAVLRPPMVYGKGCKGNYPILAKAAALTPFFPDLDNMRSMIYIGNLCEYIRQIIDKEQEGLFFPQNREYVRTSTLVQNIAWRRGRKIPLVKFFNPILRPLIHRSNYIQKIFGDLVYDKQLSGDMDGYCLFDFEQSVKLTEGL